MKEITMSKPTDIETHYNELVYKALEAHGAGPEILSLIGSWKDTLEDHEVVRMLDECLEHGDHMKPITETDLHRMKQ